MSQTIARAKFCLYLLLISAGGLPELAIAQPGATTAGARLAVFISDLHLGIGTIDGTNVWHKTEDFRWADEFGLFLRFLAREGQGKTDLVIVGDFLELWQSLDTECVGEGKGRRCRVRDCAYSNLDLGCTEAEALHRTRRILAQHRPVFEALAVFASAGENRVVIIPGNHDAALMYPSVARATLNAMAAPEGRVRIATEGYWLSADRRVLAEHGHQIDQVNRFEEWPLPFLKENSQIHLRSPWGERFVQEFYNQYEERFPVIDNISEEGEGVRLGIASGSLEDTAKAVNNFFKFLLFQVSWEQFRGSLGEQGKPPQWDIQRIKYEAGVRFLIESIPANDPLRKAAEEAFIAGTLQVAPVNLTDAEIETLCDQRAAFARLSSQQGEQLAEECPRVHGTLGAASDYLFRTRDGIFGAYLQQAYETLQRAKPGMAPFDIFVYAHTHKADSGFQPLRGAWPPTVVNTGAFQRVATPEQIKEIQAKRGLKDKEVLLVLQPEDLPACYSYIRIDPYRERPQPVLRYWAQDNGGTWQEHTQCH